MIVCLRTQYSPDPCPRCAASPAAAAPDSARWHHHRTGATTATTRPAMAQMTSACREHAYAPSATRHHACLSTQSVTSQKTGRRERKPTVTARPHILHHRPHTPLPPPLPCYLLLRTRLRLHRPSASN